MKKAFLFMGGLFLIFLLIPFIPVPGEAASGPRNRVLYVTHNPVHTALAFPYSEDWKEFPKAKFIEFSWGDIDFFVNVPTWDKLTFSLAFKAMVTPDEGLMHVDSTNEMNVPHKKLMVTEEQYQKLKKYILGSFKFKDGRPIKYPGSYYGTDYFYRSSIKYHAFHTCNNWTREGLETAGLTTSLWSPHKWGVLIHLKDANFNPPAEP